MTVSNFTGPESSFFPRTAPYLGSLQERMISMQRKVLQVEKEVAPESIYDFSFVRAANKELEGESL